MADTDRHAQTVPDSARRLAGLLRGHLAEQGIRRYEFARDQALCLKTARRWLSGNHDFSLEEIQRLSDYLGIEPAELYTPAKGIHA